MEEAEIPVWWPERPAIYDINKSYAENAEFGPFLHGQPLPTRTFAPKDQWRDFLGFRIASPIGVPAGPLLNSRWIEAASQLGYDILTYKTIRSNAHAGHPTPNMIYVHIPSDIKISAAQTIESILSPPGRMEDLAVTNSFGMPSRDRQFLKQDIPLSNSKLKEGQLMIVSVVGTPPEGNCGTAAENYSLFVKDFVDVALFAKDCGAKAIEANFSCPNVASGEGSIYQSADSTRDIASALTQALGDTPLILKVGTYEEHSLMEKVFKAASEAKVAAICGINSVSMKVIAPDTKLPALGQSRLNSGVCGGPIRPIALEFIQKGREIISKNQLKLDLMGCGGITEPGHFKEFLGCGASVALSATGMMWDPFLGARYHANSQGPQ